MSLQFPGWIQRLRNVLCPTQKTEAFWEKKEPSTVGKACSRSSCPLTSGVIMPSGLVSLSLNFIALNGGARPTKAMLFHPLFS